MRYSLVIVFVFCFVAIHAQKNKTRYDSAGVNIRQFDQQKIEVYKNSNDFHYKTADKNSIRTFWDYILYYLNKIIGLLFSNQGIIPIIRYTIIALIIAYAIIRFSNQKLQHLFSAKSRSSHIMPTELKQGEEGENFDELIQKEVKNRNFNKAVRLHYIKTLNVLNKRSYINWQENKTNKEYFNELKGKPFQQEFTRLTWIYENIWYGNFTLKEKQFSSIGEHFKEFTRKVENPADNAYNNY